MQIMTVRHVTVCKLQHHTWPAHGSARAYVASFSFIIQARHSSWGRFSVQRPGRVSECFMVIVCVRVKGLHRVPATQEWVVHGYCVCDGEAGHSYGVSETRTTKQVSKHQGSSPYSSSSSEYFWSLQTVLTWISKSVLSVVKAFKFTKRFLLQTSTFVFVAEVLNFRREKNKSSL